MLNRTFYIVAIAAALVSGAACQKLRTGGAEPKTEDEKAFYALGQDVARSIAVFNLSPHELELVKSGLSDAIQKKQPKAELDKYRPKLFELARKRQEERSAAEKAKGKEAVEKAAKEPGAQKLPSGVVMRTLKPGTGASPTADDNVKVNYRGHLVDGTEFDSSYKRNQPAEFPLRGVVKCWTEALQKMKVGEKAELTCPSDLAYGDRGRPPTIPGGATLIFEIELLDIVKKPEPAPAAMSTPPAPGAPGAAPGKPGAPAAAGKPVGPMPPKPGVVPPVKVNPPPAAPAAPAAPAPSAPAAPQK